MMREVYRARRVAVLLFLVGAACLVALSVVDGWADSSAWLLWGLGSVDVLAGAYLVSSDI